MAEQVCPSCSGQGVVGTRASARRSGRARPVCTVCHGTGTIGGTPYDPPSVPAIWRGDGFHDRRWTDGPPLVWERQLREYETQIGRFGR